MRCRPETWWRGLPALALLWGAAAWWLTPAIEQELRDRVRASPPVAESGWADVEVSGRDAVLAGAAPSAEARQAVLAALDQVGGLRGVVDRSSLRPAPALYTWSAAREGGRLVLRGHVPDAATRAALAEEARRLAPELTLADEAGIAAGAPLAFAPGAQAALRAVAALGDGQATLQGPVLAVRGAAATPEAYNRAAGLLKALPEGIQLGAVEITPPTLAPFAFRVSREGDTLILQGHVPSEALRDEINALARRLVPDLGVEDRMQTARGVPPGLDLAAFARLALAQLAQLEGGAIAVEEGRVTAEGRAGDRVALAGVEGALRAGLPAPLTLGAVRLQAVPIVPYAFAVRRGAGAVTLTGYVPDEAARAELLRQARARFLGDRIVDRLRLGDGAPAAFTAAAGYLMEQLGQLASGEASLRGTQLALAGEGLYAQALEVQRERAPRAAPPGYTLTASLKVRGVEPPLQEAACRAALDAALAAGSIQFEPGGAAFKRSSYGVLDEVAKVIRRCGSARVEIGGHLDPSGNAEATRALSQRQAQAVLDYLVRAGIEAGRLAAVGHGDARPVVPNDTEENRARNRRIEFTVKF